MLMNSSSVRYFLQPLASLALQRRQTSRSPKTRSDSHDLFYFLLKSFNSCVCDGSVAHGWYCCSCLSLDLYCEYIGETRDDLGTISVMVVILLDNAMWWASNRFIDDVGMRRVSYLHNQSSDDGWWLFLQGDFSRLFVIIWWDLHLLYIDSIRSRERSLMFVSISLLLWSLQIFPSNWKNTDSLKNSRPFIVLFFHYCQNTQYCHNANAVAQMILIYESYYFVSVICSNK